MNIQKKDNGNKVKFNYVVIFSILILLCTTHDIFGQRGGYQEYLERTENTLRKIADRIIDSTSYTFINRETGEVYSNLKGVELTPDMRVESQYNNWHYTNGVLHIAMLELADELKDSTYTDYVKKNMEFVFNPDNLGYYEKLYNEALTKEDKWTEVRQLSWHMFFRMVRLDDCGVIAASLIEMYNEEKNSAHKKYIDDVAHHLIKVEPRLDDGTISRYWPHEMTIWADDLYMSVAFLARMGKLTGENKYIDDAVKQVIQFTKYLWNDEKQLYYHCYHSDIKANGVALWARANGWIMMAQADLLSVLPDDHPKRQELIDIYNQQAEGIARYQSESGLWHQLLDKTDSYYETSASAIFTYCLAKGVRMGWLHNDFAYVAAMGWRGVQTKIDEQGNVSDICVGTGISPSLVFYYTRPLRNNIPMGEGPVIRAGTEMLKMQIHRPEPARTKYDKILSGGK